MDELFLFTVYIIVKLLLKVIHEITLQFRSPFKLLWKNIGPG